MLKHRLLQWLAISCISVLTAACGGGGGSGGSNSAGATPTTAPSTAPAAATSPTSTSPASSSSYKIHIAWTAPTTRADGSALPASSLAGYRLFYVRDGSSPSEDTVVAINGGTTTSADLSLAIAGTYTFAITAIDSSGSESVLSSPASITVN